MAGSERREVVGQERLPMAFELDMVQTGRARASALTCVICERVFVLGAGPAVEFVCYDCACLYESEDMNS